MCIYQALIKSSVSVERERINWKAHITLSLLLQPKWHISRYECLFVKCRVMTVQCKHREQKARNNARIKWHQESVDSSCFISCYLSVPLRGESYWAERHWPGHTASTYCNRTRRHQYHHRCETVRQSILNQVFFFFLFSRRGISPDTDIFKQIVIQPDVTNPH